VIVRSIATLALDSETGSAAAVTQALGITATASYEIGDSTRNALAGRPLGRPGATYPNSHWSFTADEDLIDRSDETGFGSLRVLLDVFRDKAETLASLRPDYETVIWWSGFSDSWQGGFVMLPDLLTDLAALGCELYGATYLAEPEVDDEGWIS
jgi:hypothetical protein